MNITVKDISCTPFQPLIVDGDFAITQNQYIASEVVNEADMIGSHRVLQSNLGTWRQFPSFGCSLINYINSPNGLIRARQTIKEMIEYGNKRTVNKLNISSEGGLEINFKRVNV